MCLLTGILFLPPGWLSSEKVPSFINMQVSRVLNVSKVLRSTLAPNRVTFRSPCSAFCRFARLGYLGLSPYWSNLYEMAAAVAFCLWFQFSAEKATTTMPGQNFGGAFHCNSTSYGVCRLEVICFTVPWSGQLPKCIVSAAPPIMVLASLPQ